MITTQNQKAIMKATFYSRPALTYSGYILSLLHKSWPDEEISLVKAHYTARGIKAVIRDLNDNQTYILEIYPNGE